MKLPKPMVSLFQFCGRAGLLFALAVLASAPADAEPQPPPLAEPGATLRGSFRSVLRPVIDVSLSARAAGIIDALHIPEGRPVKAGEAIMSLDADQERAELAQAEANVRGARAEMERTAAEFERVKALRTDDIFSEKQFQEAKAGAELARSRYEAAVAARQLAEVRLANRAITSPINGIFLKTNKLVGEAVERYETVARVVDVSSLEMVVYCDARYFSLFHPGQAVELRVFKSAEQQPVVSGTVIHTDPIIDPSSGTFRVKVRIEPSTDAVPGLSALLLAPAAAKSLTPPAETR